MILTLSELKLKEPELKQAAFLYRAINHSLRQTIIKLIHRNGQLSVTEIFEQLKLEQSLASQHLAILRRAGLVYTERKGKYVYYRVQYRKLEQLKSFADRVLDKGNKA